VYKGGFSDVIGWGKWDFLDEKRGSVIALPL
jgi:hypothetical protein